MSTGKCPKCRKSMVQEKGQDAKNKVYLIPRESFPFVPTDPLIGVDALEVHVWVCSGCGYVELYRKP
jgi:predicted nucleic-acid-binding Zn-ribbon protein